MCEIGGVSDGRMGKSRGPQSGESLKSLLRRMKGYLTGAAWHVSSPAEVGEIINL